jgi:hypothetical protein
VVLRLKSPYKDGTTHVVMSPLEFMQPLLVLRVPPWCRVPACTSFGSMACWRQCEATLGDRAATRGK